MSHTQTGRKVSPQTIVPGSTSDLAQQYGGSHTGGWVSRLPPSWVPYVQLARLSPPAGLFLIYFPHLLGVLHAAIVQHHPLTKTLGVSARLLGGSLFFSNAAHGWNDLIDYPVDRHIARTRKRPIVRGAISPRAALVFVLTQALGAAAFLPALPSSTAWWVVPNIAGTTYYPYAKRHTDFAQFVLGFCLAWGVIVGMSATGTDPAASRSAVCLFLACILWTVIYDTIYAHQDVEDDVKLGLKSIAVRFRDQTKPLLWVLLGAMLALLTVSGYLAGVGWQYYFIAVGGCLASLGAMIANVELKSSVSCWWWFRYGFWLAGSSMALGLLSAYVPLLL